METLAARPPPTASSPACCSINGHLFEPDCARAMIVHYDYSVLAGTQGHRDHYKQDRDVRAGASRPPAADPVRRRRRRPSRR
jgi:hypothetical protein